MEEKKHEIRLIFLIASPKLGQQASELLKREGVPEQMHAFGKGTASGELQDLLGLGSIDKNVIMTLSTEAEANRLLTLFREELYLGMPGSGVAFTIPLNAASAGLLQLVEGFGKKADVKEEESMKSEYSMILAFVNQGYSEEVMAAARAAGAGGGTVFHSRRVAGDEALHFWGIQIQEEREIVLIISRKENKTAIMNAISDKCGVRSEAHGMVISVPVDEVAGLRKEI